MTVDISSEDASLATAEVSTQITASLPIVVERSMFWAGAFAGWRESHNSFGVTATGTRWTLAEGRVGQAQGYETYILLANPNAAAAQVRVQFLRRDGTTVSKIYVVAANSRLNVYANSLPELSNEDFGALIEVINGVPIVVERSLYNSAGGVPMAAGTNAVGIRIP
jgi:hypothetical protein